MPGQPSGTSPPCLLNILEKKDRSEGGKRGKGEGSERRGGKNGRRGFLENAVRSTHTLSASWGERGTKKKRKRQGRNPGETCWAANKPCLEPNLLFARKRGLQSEESPGGKGYRGKKIRLRGTVKIASGNSSTDLCL